MEGGMAGSLGLNKRFAQAVQNLVGEDQFFYLRKEAGFEEAMKQFDKSIKTAFRGDPDEDYFVNFPRANLVDDLSNRLEANCWHMKGADVKNIFQPMIRDIERMVQDQVNLVTVKRLKERHPKANKIKLRQEATITSTVATKHYGVAAYDTYDEIEDAGQPTIKDKYTGETQVKKITWFIRRGADMRRKQNVVFPFVRRLDHHDSPSELKFSRDLLECSLDQAVKYPKQGITSTNCRLTADLTSVDKNYFRKKIASNGRPYFIIENDLVVSAGTAIMKFSLMVGGKEMGSVEAKYE
ncbi:MAG: hypothetical protein Q9178_007252 [Gyalolechia marmorata]